MQYPSRFSGRIACVILAVAFALPASGCSKSEPSAPASTVPTLTSISPTSGVSGATVVMTLTGTNFVIGSTQIATSAAMGETGITVASSTSITANILISPFGPLGDAQVLVETGAGHSNPLHFTILAPPPTLANVAPSLGGQGTTVAVGLTGTNFLGTTTVAVSGTGVTATNVAVGSSHTLKANFVIAADATPGARAITVTTPGGTSGSQSFTVETPPLTNVVPHRS